MDNGVSGRANAVDNMSVMDYFTLISTLFNLECKMF